MSTLPTAEEFEIWLENPVTQLVLGAHGRLADGLEQSFKDKAWTGAFDPIEHAECVAQARAYRDLSKITYEDALAASGMEMPE